MREDQLALVDIIDTKYLQQLQDRVADVVGISIVLLDHTGKEITSPSNPLGFCRVMREQEDGRDSCDRVNGDLCKAARASRKPEINICPHTGLTTAAVPVFLEDAFLGVWMTGQVWLRDLSAGLLIDDMEEMQGPILEFLDSVPHLWRSGLDFTLNLLAVMLSEVVALLTSNSRMMEQNARQLMLTAKIQSTMNTFRVLLNTADVFIYVADFYTGEILICNENYARIFGKTSDEMVGTYCYKNLGFSGICAFCPGQRLVDDEDKPLQSYTWENYMETHQIWLRCTNRATYWMDGRLVHVATCMDITMRKKLEEEVKKLAFQDKLLAIPNSVCLEQDLAETGPYQCLMALDIEGLRKINDIYGRHCGDLLLQALRDYLLEMDIPGSTLYHMDIADFGILLTNEAGGSDLPTQIAGRIFERCKKPWVLAQDQQHTELYVAVNVCVVPVDGTESGGLQNMYSSIEHTLEIARKCGDVAIYDDYMEKRVYTRLKLELSLKNAVRDGMNGFHLAFQPIVDPGFGVWRSIEVLCRWDSPELGAIPPLEFIPVAETTGLIGTIGHWVLESAISQVKRWGLDAVEGFLLEVNLSPVQLSMRDLGQIVVDVLKKYDYPPHKLCLEVTESNELNFSRHNMDTIEQLHALGVVIALDDFGTGYASFNSLHKLPAKVLKTDRSFINGMESDPFLQRLFHVMVDLAHSSNMKIVAEGVETEFQARYLYEQGADFFQGYLFSKPLTAARMEEQLDNFHSSSATLFDMGYAKLDLTGIFDLTNCELGPALNKMLSICMQAMYTTSSPADAIRVALAHIGEGLKVSRSYVFLKQEDGTFSNISEWCAPGIAPEIHRLQRIPIEQEYHQWTDALARDGLLVARDVRTMEDVAVSDILASQGIHAVVEFPLWKDGELYGFVGFDDCISVHNWSREEVQMLHILTGLITTALGNDQKQNSAADRITKAEQVLNNMETIVYVTDLDTDEVLFASAGLQKIYGDQVLVGKCCWDVLQCKKGRCEFCPLPRLRTNPDEPVEWEFYNEQVDRHFRIRDSIIPWGDKMAHLEYAEDITELKQYQSKLEFYASTDTLTSALNRTSFNNAVRELLETANEISASMSIVFIDIDDLKQENDTHGHGAGDYLINNVVEALRASIRDSDILGRYGGDEFLVAMMRCTGEYAHQRMQEALDRLRAAAKIRKGNYSFSYGVVENSEVAYSKSPDYLKQLIDLADQRMFAHKKKNKNACDLL